MLIFSAYEKFEGSQIASFLLTFAESIANAHKALLQGDIIGPSSPLVFGTPMDSLFVTTPLMFGEELRIFHSLDFPTVFAWLVPIHEAEANFARDKGWKKLDKAFEKENPDVWDLHRPSIFFNRFRPAT